jgi:hypothetical protein
MQPDPHRDRLIDVLLRELLGGERPPDLSARILARVRPARRWPRWAGAAAVVVLAALAWYGFLHYPAPEARGDFTVEDGGPVRRGVRIATGEGAATIHLGGYCRVTLEGALRITGQRRAERVFLEAGEVVCDVNRSRGSFAVETEAGEVSVKGTEFSVRIVPGQGGGAMTGKQMLVRVMMGAVLVSGAWGQATLQAGEEGEFPRRRAETPDRPAIPAGLAGFRGYLIGAIASMGNKGVTLEVANAKALAGSRAENPQAAVGKKLPIHYKAHGNREGGYTPSKELMERIARLRKRGGLVTLRVRSDGDALIADAAWAGAQLDPARADPARRDGEGEGRRERRGEGDREGEGRRERRGEGDREGEGRRERRGEGDREGKVRRERRGEGDREGEGRRERRGEGDREGEVRRERRGEGDREGEVRRERRGEGDGEWKARRERREDGEERADGPRRERREHEGDRDPDRREDGEREERRHRDRDADREGDDHRRDGDRDGDREADEDDGHHRDGDRDDDREGHERRHDRDGDEDDGRHRDGDRDDDREGDKAEL